MFFETRLHHLIDNIRARASIPMRLELWDGRIFDLSPCPTVKVLIPGPSALRYFIPPDLNKLGHAFVEGHIQVDGPIHEIFRVAERLVSHSAIATRKRLFRLAAHGRQSDKNAIEYHYNVSNDFYRLFLDKNMVYSCAYFCQENDPLDRAQEQKLDHILRKLDLQKGEHFLDIGCGWGALIIRAAKQYGAIAKGVTLSESQFQYTRNRIIEEGLEDCCSVDLVDYRDIADEGTYDKIASVGMFEHVGLKNLPFYFTKIHSLLTDNGLVLNHGITTSDVEGRWMGLGAGEFIDRYVFPQGELPHLSLVQKEMSLAGLEVTDVESLRRHYAKTCHEWATRLEKNAASALYHVEEKQLRIWEIYLAGSAFGFANGWMNLYQILACKADIPHANPLPLTRQYMYR